MNRFSAYGFGAALFLTAAMSPLAFAPVAVAQAPADYSSKSLIGTLLDNPESKAVLVKIIPAVANNPMIDAARELPLEGLAPFEPALTPQILAQIDAELAKIKKK
jgi:hypothetical protein